MSLIMLDLDIKLYMDLIEELLVKLNNHYCVSKDDTIWDDGFLLNPVKEKGFESIIDTL